MNGFSYFWLASPKAKDFSVCRCGWRPDWGEHYSGRPHQKILKRVLQVEKVGAVRRPGDVLVVLLVCQ
jgi:hypothetical protein